MTRFFPALRALLITGVFLAAQVLSAQVPRLVNWYEGAYNMPASMAKGKQTVPAPILIRTQAAWDAFIAGIPAKVNNPNIMGGPLVDNDDPALQLEPHFDTRFYVVVFQDPSRGGPLRFDSVTTKGDTVTFTATVVTFGVEARPIDLGYYNLYEISLSKAVGKTLKYEPKTAAPPGRRIQPDDVSGIFGIMDYNKGGWAVKPKWTMANEFDLWAHSMAVDNRGWLLVDKDGKEILRPFIYDNGPDYFQEGLARYVDSKNKIGYFDYTGTIAIKAQWDFADPFSDGTAKVYRGGKMVSDGENSVWQGGEFNTIDNSGTLLGTWTALK